MIGVAAGSAVRKARLTDLGVIASAIGASAVAIWLVPASVQIIAWPADGPERVAYFAPLARVWWIALGAVVLFGALLAGPAFWLGRRRSGVERAAIEMPVTLAWIAAPLQWLWVWTLPFWPVLPDREPLVLGLAGPLRWVLAAAALAAVLVRIARVRGWTLRPLPLGRRTVFVVSAAIYIAAGLAWNQVAGFTADEPHYLVVAHSLLVDHDLNIENNHARRDYSRFYPGTLKPDYLARGRHGEIYSVHAPGLPVLILPAYAIAGARGALVFVSLIGALTALAVFDVGVLLGGPATGWLAWAAVCMTVPVVPYAWLIFPEIAAALIAAWALRWLTAPLPSSALRWLLRGAAMAVLPWLHTKYVLLLAPLAAFVALDVRLRGPAGERWKALVSFAAPIGVSVIGWFASFFVMYGVFDPQAPYGSFAAEFVRTANVARGLLGLSIDQKFGLFVYAPVYLGAVAAVPHTFRDRRRWVAPAAALTTIVLFVASSARFYMWWGGSSAPARFLVPVAPLAVPFVAAAIRRWRRLFGAGLVVSLAISAGAMLRPADRLLFSAPHGSSQLMTMMQGSAPLTSAWPTFTEPEWHGQIGRAARALTGHFTAEARAETAERGRETLLANWDGTGVRAYDYLRRARADEAFVFSHAVLQRTRAAGDEVGDPARLLGPFALAAGDYFVHVQFAGDPAPVTIRYHRGPPLATLAPRDGEITSGGRFELPVDAPEIWIGAANAAAAAGVLGVEFVPVALVPRSGRVGVEPVAIEPIAGGGLVVYADRNSFPEGGVFWTAGTRRATVYVAPGGAERLTATLFLGPDSGNVRLTVGATEREIPVKAGTPSEVSIDVDRRQPLIPLTIEAPAGFTPSAVDPRSDDNRLLGCQVRFRVGGD